MKIFKRITGKIVRVIINSRPEIKTDLIWYITENARKNPEETNFILSRFKKELAIEIDKYPSVFNQGYFHIEKAIEFVRYFNLPQSSAIIDVGAPNGTTSIMFSEAFPSSIIYAFEPLPQSFEILRKATSSFSNIKVINKALGSSAATVQMHVSARVTSSSLFPIEKVIKNKFFAENIKETSLQNVVIDTLDASIPASEIISLIKIDVQGYELEVLKGGIETLKRTAIILLEMQNHELYIGAPKYFELDAFLRNSGFELYDIIPSIRQDKKLYEWDSIYVNKAIIN